MPNNDLPEELVALLHAISEDESLCRWLLTLQQLPITVRRTELGCMAARMRADAGAEDVASAVSALARPELYEAACNTLRELHPELLE